MKHAVLAVLVLAGIPLAGCGEMIPMRDYEIASKGMTKDDFDPNAPRSDHELQAAIRRDVRDVWIWQADVHKGTPTCPGMRLEGAKPVCSVCKEAPTMKVFTIRADQPDQVYPQKQSAYLCPDEMVYWLHVEGGIDRWNAWLGPRRLKASARSDDHDH